MMYLPILPVFINSTSLAYLMEHCQSLKALALRERALDDANFRALGDFSKPGLEIELKYCRIVGIGAEALAEVLGPDHA